MAERRISIDFSSPAFALFCIFLILKVTHTVDWSWFWVTMPLWLGLAVIATFGALLVLALSFAWLIDKRDEWRRAKNRRRNNPYRLPHKW